MERRRHDQLVDRAFTRQSETFNESAIANASELLDALVQRAAPQPGERWLEAACGPGIVSRRLASRVRSVHGIDMTAAMVDTARREAAGAGLANATFEVGDAAATGLPGASFDGAVTRFSLHHIPLPGRVLSELARVVAPGGTIAVLDHLADDDGEARAWAQEIERLRDPSHWASLTAAQLRALGAAAGLEPVHEQVFTFELDLDDWLARGSDDSAARELVRRALAERPGGTDCFGVTPAGRVLALRMWLGVWRR